MTQSFNRYLLTLERHFSYGHCYADTAVNNKGIGPDLMGFTFELEKIISIIWFLKVNIGTKGR